MATKSPRRPDGDLNGSWEPNGDQNKPFGTPLGHHGHLGRHQVVKAIWSWHLRSPSVFMWTKVTLAVGLGFSEIP